MVWAQSQADFQILAAGEGASLGTKAPLAGGLPLTIFSVHYLQHPYLLQMLLPHFLIIPFQWKP